MSIETAKYVVQRGANQFKCRGDQLDVKLQTGDLLVVQHENESEASKYVWDGPDGILDTDWLCCTDPNTVTYKIRGSRFKELFVCDVEEFIILRSGTDVHNWPCPYVEYPGKVDQYTVYGDPIRFDYEIKCYEGSYTIQWFYNDYFTGDHILYEGIPATIPESFARRTVLVRAVRPDGSVIGEAHEAFLNADIRESICVEVDFEMYAIQQGDKVKYRINMTKFATAGLPYLPIDHKDGYRVQTGYGEHHNPYLHPGDDECWIVLEQDIWDKINFVSPQFYIAEDGQYGGNMLMHSYDRCYKCFKDDVIWITDESQCPKPSFQP